MEERFPEGCREEAAAKLPGSMPVRILFTALQISWGFPQTLAGFLLFLKYRKQPHRPFHYAVSTVWEREFSGISLGLFLFAGKTAGDSFLAHEYGHSIQSLLLGPLYLPLIGLPSLIWSRAGSCVSRRAQEGKDYYSFYTEAWAEHIANRFRR